MKKLSVKTMEKVQGGCSKHWRCMMLARKFMCRGFLVAMHVFILCMHGRGVDA